MNLEKDWVRTKDFLLCVDSDGCAMDTMDIKHKTCFGPQLIECYGLDAHRQTVQTLWNEINLYRTTRGINRFLGLVLALDAIEADGICALPHDRLADWTRDAQELSNPALAKQLEKTNDPQLALAYRWSCRVNEAIANLPDDHGAFPGVKASLATLSKIADIAVVSSANSQALQSEWRRCHLDEHISALLGQECGSKAHCIAELLRVGQYGKRQVLMIGDAPGDWKAAEANGVGFYPILVKKEEFSWRRLCDQAIDKLTNDTFAGVYQEQLQKEFFDNLS